MTEHKTADRIAALERARAQIEIALSSNEDWLAFRRAAAGSRLLYERALAGNALYKSWDLLNEAIQDLHAKGSQPSAVQARTANDDLTRVRGIGPTLAQRLADHGITTYGQIAAWRPDDVRDVAEALGLDRKISRQNWIEQAALLELRGRAGKSVAVMEAAGQDIAAPQAAQPAEDAREPSPRARARSIGLHHVLEHIRSDAAQRGGGLPAIARDRPDEAADAAPTADVALSPAADANAGAPERAVREQAPELQPPEGVDVSDGAGRLLPEPEEATVTFVIREPVLPASGDDHSGDARSRRPLSDRAAASGGVRDAHQSPTNSQAEEADVVIVSRPADRSSVPRHRPRKT